MIKQAKDQFLIVNLRGEHYAIPLTEVEHLLTVPKVTTLPQAPPTLRGTIELAGKVLELWDLRVVLGMTSAKQGVQQLLAMLQEMEAEEIRCLDDLQQSMQESGDDPSGTDAKPGQEDQPGLDAQPIPEDSPCRLSAWLERFRARRSNELSGAVNALHEVHDRLHEMMDRCRQLSDNGDPQEACELLSANREKIHADLAARFQQVRGVISDTQREIAVVLSLGEKRVVAAVDSVLGVESLKLHAADEVEDWMKEQSNLKLRTASRLGSEQEMVLVLDVESLLGQV